MSVSRVDSDDRRGFTVVETLVFSGMLLLLLASIVMVMQAGMRYQRLGAAYQEAQSQSMVGLKKMVEELSQSTPIKRLPASPFSDAKHVIALSPQPPPPAESWSYQGGSLQYHQWMAFYHDGTAHTLVRATLPVNGGPCTSTLAPDAPPLGDFQTASRDLQLRPLAHGVKAFSIGENGNARQLIVSLTCSVATNSQSSTDITTRGVVTMENP